jgi:hypothetical protein
LLKISSHFSQRQRASDARNDDALPARKKAKRKSAPEANDKENVECDESQKVRNRAKLSSTIGKARARNR